MPDDVKQIGYKGVFETAEFKKGLDAYIKGIHEAAQATKDAATRMANQGAAAKGTGDSFSSLGAILMGVASGGTALLISALGTGLFNAFGSVTSAIREATSAVTEFGSQCLYTAGRVDELERSALLLGQRAGYTREATQGFLDALAEQGIQADVSAQTIAQLARYNIDLSRAVDLATVSQNAAVLAGEGSSENMAGLIHGITTYNSRVLRTHGLNVDIAGSQERLAEQLGITTDQLTEADKVQAAFNAVLAEGERVTGVYAAAMDSPTKALRSLDREIFNLRTAIGRPFLDAWNNVVGIMRFAVGTLMDMVSEGGALYPVLVNLGAVLSLVTEALATMAKNAIEAVQIFLGQFTGDLQSGLMDAAVNALTWGVEISTQLASGLIQGAINAVTAAMRFISSLLTYWLAPGSPPRVAPDIDKWALETMGIYLKSMTEADFSVLKKLQGPLKQILGPEAFAGVSQEIARALTEGADEAFYARLAAVAGDYGEEIAQLARLHFELADATNAVESAQNRYTAAQGRVSSLTREYNELLKAGASKEVLRAKQEQINAAYAERDAAEEQIGTTEENVAALEDRASLQEQLVQQLLELSKAQERAAATGAGAGAGAGAGLGAGLLPMAEDMEFDLTTAMGTAIDNAKALLREKFAELFAPIGEAWANIRGLFVNEFIPEFQTLTATLGEAWASIKTGAELAWAGVQSAIQTVINFYNENLKPVIDNIVEAFSITMALALETAAAAWKEVLLPALQIVNDFIDTSLKPLFLSLTDLLSVGLSLALEATGNILNNLFFDALTAVRDATDNVVGILQTLYDNIIADIEPTFKRIGESVLPAISGAFETIGGAIDTVRGYIDQFVEKLAGIELPEWAQRHSPSPIEQTLGGMKAYLDAMSRVSLPAFQAQLARTEVAAPPSITYNQQQTQTTYAPQASFGPNYFSDRIGQQQFDQMANNWFRRSLQQQR